jgi:hypothetical protein
VAVEPLRQVTLARQDFRIGIVQALFEVCGNGVCAARAAAKGKQSEAEHGYPRIGSVHSIRVTLGTADIAFDECRAKRNQTLSPLVNWPGHAISHT